MRHPSSVMCKSLLLGMSNEFVIQNDDEFYTVASVKLLFTALTVGNAVIEKSIFSPYDMLVVPFLAHYLCVGESDLVNAVLNDCWKHKYTNDNVNDILTILLPVVNMYIDSHDKMSEEFALFGRVKDKLLKLLANHASHSFDNYFYKWSNLASDDICTVVKNIKSVELCTYRRLVSNCNWELVTALDGAGKLCKIAADDKRFGITWENSRYHFFYGMISTEPTSSTVIPSPVKVFCSSNVRWSLNPKRDIYASIYRHGWQMRYEVVMAYLLQTRNEALSEDYHIEEHVGVRFSMLFRGLIAMQKLNCDEQTSVLRNVLIETTAALIRCSPVNNFDLPLIDELSCTDVADICICRSFVSFVTSSDNKSFVFDMLKFVITWKNAVAKSTSCNKPSAADALAFVKLVIHGVDFTDTSILGKRANETEMFLEWIKSHGGDDLKVLTNFIVQSLSNMTASAPN